jgi:hypothetical protein
MQHVIHEQDSHEHLLERILSSDNMHRAWKRVKENKGAPGVDNMSGDEMPDSLREHWQEIRKSLMEGTYQPSPVLRVEIPKPTGGTRSLGIPTVVDRLMQQAIAQVLTEICDPDFSESRFGFRLLKRGVPLKATISVGRSRKSFWRVSKTYATQLGMTNQWLKEQGLISIKDLWVNRHDPATAR